MTGLVSSEDDDVETIIATLEKEGLAVISDDNIQLTEKGYSKAKALVRRLRLAEQLFTDVFELTGIALLQTHVRWNIY
jgi:Mn-dependent DtxR family transcriptional regulator